MGQTSSQPHRRLSTFSIDIVHLPLGKGGFKYILTLLDISTRWMEAFPLQRATSEKICRIIEHQIIPRYGQGLTFMIDQGREFIAEKMTQLANQFNCTIHLGTSYNPNSKPVERYHRVLGDGIRSQLAQRNWPKERWPELLSDVIFTMRCSPDTATKESPFQRVFGQNPVTEAKVIWSSDLQDEDQQYQDELQERKDEVSKKMHLKNKQYVAENTKEFQPKQGDLVDWKQPLDPNSKNSKKLANKWTGPFRILYAEPQTAIIIRVIDNEDIGKSRKVSITKLRPSLNVSENQRDENENVQENDDGQDNNHDRGENNDGSDNDHEERRFEDMDEDDHHYRQRQMQDEDHIMQED